MTAIDMRWCRMVRKAVVVGMLATVLGGCARELTITQEAYINTAMYIGDPAGSERGEPLEINIVCVTPKDLKHEANDALDPDAGITSEAWFRDRPIVGDKKDTEDRGGRLYLPKDQIFLMTYDTKSYGKRIGDPLRGAATDRKEKVVREFNHAGHLHNDKSVIYVFAKFVDQNGQVLPVPPAKFHPPGAYTEDLFVKIGVDQTRAHFGQYIDNVTKRKLHGSGNGE